MFRYCLLIILFTASCILATTVKQDSLHDNIHQCGVVFDGLTNGKFDLSSQTSVNTIAANWFGFSEKVIAFEWAIISQTLQKSEDLVPGNCGEFRAVPDVQSWIEVSNSNFAINAKLSLENGNTYYTLVRATLTSGAQIVAMSDGVTINAQQEQQTTESEIEIDSSNFIHRRTRSIESTGRSRDTPRLRLEKRATKFPIGSCPITENNCRNAKQQRVGEKLLKEFGPPVFRSTTRNIFTVGNDVDRVAAGLQPLDEVNDDDDDSSGGGVPAWVLAPIILGIAALFLIILIILVILILIIGVPKSDSGSSDTTENYNIDPLSNQDDDKTGRNKGVTAGTVATDTRVEFPDTNINRLSITPQETADAPTNDPKSPRRKPHPMMNSASSSFRDYRNT